MNLHGEIYLRDRLQGTTICPSQVVFDQWGLPQEETLIRRAFNPALSEDGRYLVFLDGDCLPSEHFVARHLALARPRRFCTGCSPPSA